MDFDKLSGGDADFLKLLEEAKKKAKEAALAIGRGHAPARTGELKKKLRIKAQGSTCEVYSPVAYFDIVAVSGAAKHQIRPKRRRALVFTWKRANVLKKKSPSGIKRKRRTVGVRGVMRTQQPGVNKVFFRRIKRHPGMKANSRFVRLAKAEYERVFRAELSKALAKNLSF